MEERSEVLRAVVRHLTDQLVSIPLYYDANPSMIGNRMVNVAPGYLGNAHQWDVKS